VVLDKETWKLLTWKISTNSVIKVQNSFLDFTSSYNWKAPSRLMTCSESGLLLEVSLVIGDDSIVKVKQATRVGWIFADTG
jgi:hypothetical protein